jgi:hypothetical protein
MKLPALLTITGCVFGLVGCDQLIPKPPAGAQMRVISRLDCPQVQGDLTLESAAPDGQSCHYTGGSNAQADIRLISLTGRSMSEALAPLEAELKSKIPSHPADASDQDDNRDEVHVDVPGIRIDASDKTETADIHLPGLSVNVNGDRTSVTMGTRTTPVADTDGRPVRPVPGRIDRTFIVTSDDEHNSPFALLAYTARGPSTGPLAVAIVQVPQPTDPQDDNSDERDLLRDAEQILKANVGGRRSQHGAEVHIN